MPTPFLAPALNLLAVLFLAFALSGLNARKTSGIFTAYIGQSLTLAACLAVLGVGTRDPLLLGLALLNAAGKGFVVPWILRRHLHRELLDQAEFGSYLSPPLAFAAAAILLVLAFALLPADAAASLHFLLVVGLAAFFWSLAAQASRREALPQVLSLFLGENGVILGLVALISGFSLLAEMSLFLDLWLLALVAGILVRRMYQRLGHTDVSKLNKLRG